MAQILYPLAAIVLALVTVSASGQDWLPAIVRVECGRGVGTGTLVARYEQDGRQGGYVLTARHVVEEGPACVVVWQSGYRSAGHVDARGERYDTALIRVSPPTDAPVITVAEDPAPQGSVVQVFGYGGQSGQRVDRLQLMRGEVKVRGYADYGNEQRIVCDPWCVSGDSGGPIVYQDQIVGLVSGYSEPRDTRGPHCTPIRNLLRLVLPHGIVAGIDAQRARNQSRSPLCLPGGS